MAYNSIYPMDNEYISQLPKSIRDKGEQLRTEQIVDAGMLQGLTASDLDQRTKFDVEEGCGHRHTGVDGDAPLIPEAGLVDGAATDAKIGNRTVNDNIDVLFPESNAGTLTQLLSWLAKRLRQIIGGSSWREALPTTLAGAKAHMDNVGNPHGVTFEQVGAAPVSHVSDINNPHGVTAAQIGAWPLSQWPGRVCLVVDDTEVAKTVSSTEWYTVKNFRWYKHADMLGGGTKLRMAATLWGTTGTNHIRFLIDSTPSNEKTSNSPAEGLVFLTEMNLSSVTAGLKTINIQVRRSTNSGTVRTKYLEFVVEY